MMGSMDSKKFEQWFALALIFAAALARLLPHPPNFTPLTAAAVFSGTVLSPAVALTVPLAAMIASDMVVGPHPLFFLTWGCFLVSAAIGFWVRRDPRTFRVVFGTLAGSLIFFVVTNLGVFWASGMYEKNFSGLAECFTLAIPFFGNSLAGDFFFVVVFFGVFSLARRAASRLSADA